MFHYRFLVDFFDITEIKMFVVEIGNSSLNLELV